MATWANTTFCTLEDIDNRVPDAYNILSRSRSEQGSDVELQICITNGKAELKKKLEIWAADTFVDTIDNLLTRSRKAIQDGIKRRKLDAELTYGTVWYIANGSQFFDLQNVTYQIPPKVYYNGGVPVNGTTLANTAAKGSYLIDTVNWTIPYKNTGTLASPTWEAFNSRDILDNILNPTDLMDANIYVALQLAAERGMFRDGALEKSMNWELYWKDKFLEELYGSDSTNGKKKSKGVLSLIRFDITGDGLTSDFERRAQGQKKAAFA